MNRWLASAYGDERLEELIRLGEDLEDVNSVKHYMSYPPTQTTAWSAVPMYVASPPAPMPPQQQVVYLVDDDISETELAKVYQQTALQMANPSNVIVIEEESWPEEYRAWSPEFFRGRAYGRRKRERALTGQDVQMGDADPQLSRSAAVRWADNFSMPAGRMMNEWMSDERTINMLHNDLRNAIAHTDPELLLPAVRYIADEWQKIPKSKTTEDLMNEWLDSFLTRIHQNLEPMLP